MQGWFPTGGSGSIGYAYFVVAKDTTAGTQTSPMQVLNYSSTGSDTITVRWPRVANGADVMTYDLLRMATPAGAMAVYPYRAGVRAVRLPRAGLWPRAWLSALGWCALTTTAAPRLQQVIRSCRGRMRET